MIMMKDVRQYIREIVALINDDALFHKRDVPGDQDDYEDRPTGDRDPGVVRHDVYDAINGLINVYDKVGDDYTDPIVIENVKNIRQLIAKLTNSIR